MLGDKEYDLICSLGANCSTAHQLKHRGLRKVALPFDWTYFDTLEALEKLIEGFENNFVNFMKKENLQKLEQESYSNEHSDRIQYKDIYTNFFYYNHFNTTNNETKEQDRVIKIFQKRCKRLNMILQNSKKVLFILSSRQDFPIETLKKLLNTIQKKYPSSDIYVYCQVFNCKENKNIQIDNLTITKHTRCENNYDYTQTNQEWSFLDNLTTSDLVKNKKKIKHLFNIKRIRKGVSVKLFSKINTILYLKIYLFGRRLHFTLGKEKNE